VRNDPRRRVSPDGQAFFDERRRGFSLYARTHVDVGLECVRAPRSRAFPSPAWCSRERFRRRARPDTEIVIVNDVATATDFGTVGRKATPPWPRPESAALLFARPEALLAPHLVSVVAYRNGRPVSAGWRFSTGSRALLVGTLPKREARPRRPLHATSEQPRVRARRARRRLQASAQASLFICAWYREFTAITGSS